MHALIQTDRQLLMVIDLMFGGRVSLCYYYSLMIHHNHEPHPSFESHISSVTQQLING